MTHERPPDPLFEAINKGEPGLYVWRVENKRVDGVPEFGLAVWHSVGHFTTGDSYVVLSQTRGKLTTAIIRHVYMWIGSKSTQDEFGVAAIKATHLSDYLDGATHHREVQGHESPGFIARFDEVGGVKVDDGDHPSGWRAPEVEEKAMYKIKGARQPVMLRVPVSGKSLNEGDAFIVVTPTNIWLWLGPKANTKEKLKASQVAEIYRGKNAKAKFERVEGPGAPPEFWEAIGGETPVAPADEEDRAVEVASVCRIYKAPDFALVAEGPAAKRSLLTGSSILFVHRGEDVLVFYPKGTKGNTFELAAQFIQAKSLPPYVAVCDAHEGVADDDIEVLFA